MTDSYLTATREIRNREKKGQHIPIIALTAHAHEEARVDCLEAGMDNILVKPLRLDALEATVKKYILHQPEEDAFYK